MQPHCGPGAIPLSIYFLLPYFLAFSYFYVLLFSFLTCFIYFCFSIPSHSTKIVSLHFKAGCRRRRLNLALFLCVFILCYMHFLVKDACLFLLYLIQFCLAV